MERYSDYKDSGVKWLGEIPSHWETIKNKFLFRETDERNTDRSYKLLSFSKSKGIIPFDENSDKENSSDNLAIYKVLHKGQLLENRLQAWNGMFLDSNIEGCVSPDYSVFDLSIKDANIRYFSYLFRTNLYVEQWANASKGIGSGFNRLYTPQFGNIISIFPPREEQDAIVSYLDDRIAKIDAAIAQQQKMIDLLNERKQIIINRAVTKGLDPNAKMKDSGVEWIGEVPEHWEVRSFKTMMAIQRGHDLTAEEFKMGEIPVYGSGGLMGFHNVVTSKGPCIVIGRSGSVGKLQYIEEDFWAHNTAIYLTDNKGNDIKYLYYLLKSVDLSALATQTAVPTLDRKNVLSYKVPCCLDKIEQEEISHYLDGVLSKIDQMISTVNGKISLLQERKQIIINEVVTGKVRIL